MSRIILTVFLFLSLGIIYFSTKDLVWDEWYHIPLGKELFEQGLSVSFLRNMNVAMGPLYAMILSLCFYFSDGGISIESLRALNWCFLLGLLFLISRIFSNSKVTSLQLAITALSIPFLSLMSLFAMSDIPALFFFFLSIFFIKQSNTNSITSLGAFSNIALAGFSMGLCVLIRQTYLVSWVGIFWLAWKTPKNRRLSLTYLLMALPLPLILFYIWGGITPPLIAAIERQRGHFSSTHFLLAISQTSLIYYFFFPKRLFKSKKLFAGTSALFVLLTPLIDRYLVSNLSERLPVRFVFKGLFGSWHSELAKYLLVISFAMGFLFLFDLIKQFRKSSEVLKQSLLLSGAALVCYPIFVTSNYSSRYPLAGLLLLILIEEPVFGTSHFWRLARLIFGCGLGLGVGAYYLRIFFKAL